MGRLMHVQYCSNSIGISRGLVCGGHALVGIVWSSSFDRTSVAKQAHRFCRICVEVLTLFLIASLYHARQ